MKQIEPITFWYTNHRKEVAERTITPLSVDWIVDPGYGYDTGWFLTGFCHDKQAIRSFKLDNIITDKTTSKKFSLPLLIGVDK